MRIGKPGGMKTRRQERRDKEHEESKHNIFRKPPPTVDDLRLKPLILENKGQDASAPVLPPPDDILRGGGSLPPAEWIEKNAFRLMRQVDVIMPRLTEFGASTDVRQSIIHDQDEEGNLYIAQPSPPISKAHLGNKLEITALLKVAGKEGETWTRVGYRARVMDIIFDYPIKNDVTEDVVKLAGPKTGELKPRSLRLSFRINPPGEIDLRLYLSPENHRLWLLDLSAAGLSFYSPQLRNPDRGQTLKVILKTGETTLELNCQVVRTGPVVDRFGREQTAVSVEFYNLTPKVQNKMSQLATEIYRYLLSLRSGIAKGR